MTRKAEFSGHIIMFVLGLVVVAGILFFGYNVISNVSQSQCETERVRFGTQLQTYIDRNKGYGTNRLVSMDLPCQVTAVCFVDRGVVDESIQTGTSPAITVGHNMNSLSQGAIDTITASVQNQVPANVFFIESQQTALPVQRFSAQSAAIQVSDGSTNALCIEGVGGRLDLRLRGTGRLVQVSIPQ